MIDDYDECPNCGSTDLYRYTVLMMGCNNCDHVWYRDDVLDYDDMPYAD